MMNSQHTHIRVPTTSAFTAKSLYQFKFALPVANRLLGVVNVLVPELIAAINITKAVLRRLPAIRTTARTLPSLGMIALLPAVFSIALIDEVLVYFEGLTAMFTNSGFSCLFHNCIISQFVDRTYPTYFDIAVKRIKQAQLQMRMEI